MVVVVAPAPGDVGAAAGLVGDPDDPVPPAAATVWPPELWLLVVAAGVVTCRTADSLCPPPLATMVYVPGVVDAGMVTDVVKPPELSAVAEPRLVPYGLIDNATFV